MDPCQRCYTEDLGLESQIGPRNNPLQRCCWGPDATVGPRPGLERLVVGPTTWPSGSEMRASIPRDSTEVSNWRRRRSTYEIVWIRFLEDHEGKRLFDEEGSLWLASLDRQWREPKSGEKRERERKRETRRPWKCETRRVHWRRYQSAGIGFQWMNRRLWMCLFDFAWTRGLDRSIRAAWSIGIDRFPDWTTTDSRGRFFSSHGARNEYLACNIVVNVGNVAVGKCALSSWRGREYQLQRVAKSE